MSTGGGGGRAPVAEINVTPLVDVMLVLLIIFMVAAPMMTTGIKVELPNADAPPVEANQEVPLVIITEDRKVWLAAGPGEPTEVTLDTLEARIRENPYVMREHEAYVQADENVPYGVVAQVLAKLRRAGAHKTGLITDPLVSQSP